MIPSVDLRAQYRQIKPGLNEAIAGVIESWKFVLADEGWLLRKSSPATLAPNTRTGQRQRFFPNLWFAELTSISNGSRLLDLLHKDEILRSS